MALRSTNTSRTVATAYHVVLGLYPDQSRKPEGFHSTVLPCLPLTLSQIISS